MDVSDPPATRDNQPRVDTSAGDYVRRHRLSTRIWHWSNALIVFVMLLTNAPNWS